MPPDNKPTVGSGFNSCLIRVQSLSDAVRILEDLGVERGGVTIMKSKMRHLVVSVENIQARATHILKQVMLSRGGECATPREVYLLTNEPVKVVMMGTVNQFRDAIINLRLQPFGLSRLAAELQELIDGAGSGVTGMRTIEAGRHSLTVGGRTLVMGILNVTPDSFSDGGMYNSLDEAVSRAHEMVEAGVDIIDIGGESTRPGSEPVPPDEELRRTIPVIKAIASEIEVPISIDTCKSAVASEALDAGAVMVNDISGLRMDPEMVALVSEADVPVVVMHMQGVPQNMQDNPEYGDVVQDIARFLREQASVAVAGGISREKIIIDPGIGFGKTLDHNLEIIRRLDEFKSIGYPVLCGPSRKKFIGAVLGRETDQRVFGTAATVAFAVDRGADMVRLHDIEEVLDVVKMSDALAGRDEGAAVSTALSRPDRP